MMTLLAPLGLLGLLGVVALIIIYIIRPNYQVKHISSTYVWKLSLKYKRKRIPTSRLRNLLLFLCQLFILTLMAGILTMPVIVTKSYGGEDDVIIILDSSASMYAGAPGQAASETRFLRALSDAKDVAEEAFGDGAKVSVILAEEEPSYLYKRLEPVQQNVLFDRLDEMSISPYPCSFGRSDLEAAVKLCDEVLALNPAAEIFIYTDVNYQYMSTNTPTEGEEEGAPELFHIMDVKGENDWNAAILDARVTLRNNIYELAVDVASYGRAADVTVKVEVKNANASGDDPGKTIEFEKTVLCSEIMPEKTIIFAPKENSTSTEGDNSTEGEDPSAQTVYQGLGDGETFFSFREMFITIRTSEGEYADSFAGDDSFNIYGGQKEKIRVQYMSSLPNPFFTTVLEVLGNRYADRYDISLTEVKAGYQPALAGFDLYIFEHTVPEALPTDGVVFLADPSEAPRGAGFTIGPPQDVVRRFWPYLTMKNPHPLSTNIKLEAESSGDAGAGEEGEEAASGRITVSRYSPIIDYDAMKYTEVFSLRSAALAEDLPALLACKQGTSQIVVMPFSVHYSNLVMTPEFYLLMRNVINYYFPTTLSDYSVEVGESVEVNSRGSSVSIMKGDDEKNAREMTDLPVWVQFDIPGTYIVLDTSYFGSSSEKNIFVKIPASESNIFPEGGALLEPERSVIATIEYDDLLIYLAAAMVLLLFAEWALQWRDIK